MTTLRTLHKCRPAQRISPQVTTKNSSDACLETKIIIKGKVPVDPQCATKVNSAHVLQEEDEVFNFMLNQVGSISLHSNATMRVLEVS